MNSPGVAFSPELQRYADLDKRLLMAVRGIDGWGLVATFSVASHVWQCYAVDASKAAE